MRGHLLAAKRDSLKDRSDNLRITHCGEAQIDAAGNPQAGESVAVFPPRRGYASVSIQDLLDARDAYQVHLSSREYIHPQHQLGGYGPKRRLRDLNYENIQFRLQKESC